MIGIVYNDSGTDKIITSTDLVFDAVIPTAITDGDLVIRVDSSILEFTKIAIKFFRSSYFINKSGIAFRFVNISIVPDDSFTLSESATGSLGEKIVLVSNDDLNIVAYRSGSYQVVTIASLLSSEIVDIGTLTYTQLGDVMTAAGGLTSAQIKYIQPIGNDTVTFTEIV